MTNLMAQLVAAIILASTALHAAPWLRHTIDDSSRGADGVRLADINGDGRPDIATGWEEGGRVRVYLNPGAAQVKERWPAVTVGQVKSPEDAVFADIDGDGILDVVSSCEGSTRTAFVHFAPRDRGKLLDPLSWRTEAIPATERKQQWMYALPLEVDNRRGTDLVIGSKNKQGSIGWLEAPTVRGDLAGWKYHRMREAGWIMSLEAADIDGDGHLDILASDRKGEKRGVFWLENPTATAPASEGQGASLMRWPEHSIGGEDREVMFLHYADLDGDGRKDVVVAAKPRRVLIFSPPSDPRHEWKTEVIDLEGNIGHSKAAHAADIDLDGHADLVVTCEGATGDKSGVAWFGRDVGQAQVIRWTVHDISGPPGTKFDRMEVLDLDEDGDLDVMTCEEAENLGVIWYENPAR